MELNRDAVEDIQFLEDDFLFTFSDNLFDDILFDNRGQDFVKSYAQEDLRRQKRRLNSLEVASGRQTLGGNEVMICPSSENLQEDDCDLRYCNKRRKIERPLRRDRCSTYPSQEGEQKAACNVKNINNDILLLPNHTPMDSSGVSIVSIATEDLPPVSPDPASSMDKPATIIDDSSTILSCMTSEQLDQQVEQAASRLARSMQLSAASRNAVIKKCSFAYDDVDSLWFTSGSRTLVSGQAQLSAYNLSSNMQSILRRPIKWNNQSYSISD